MLFRKKIEKSCSYCIHGTRLNDSEILCTKKGIRTEEQKCMRFRYDPTRRIPKKQKALDFSQFDSVDYSL